ncbi:hypothetical protein BDN72DRAFT_880274, partial [Pluteus cervinus]
MRERTSSASSHLVIVLMRFSNSSPVSAWSCRLSKNQVPDGLEWTVFSRSSIRPGLHYITNAYLSRDLPRLSFPAADRCTQPVQCLCADRSILAGEECQCFKPRGVACHRHPDQTSCHYILRSEEGWQSVRSLCCSRVCRSHSQRPGCRAYDQSPHNCSQ